MRNFDICLGLVKDFLLFFGAYSLVTGILEFITNWRSAKKRLKTGPKVRDIKLLNEEQWKFEITLTDGQQFRAYPDSTELANNEGVWNIRSMNNGEWWEESDTPQDLVKLVIQARCHIVNKRWVENEKSSPSGTGYSYETVTTDNPTNLLV